MGSKSESQINSQIENRKITSKVPLVVRMSHDVYFAISIKKKSSLPRKINARTQNS